VGGYEAEAKVLVLTFEDHPGLEVTARSPSTGGLLDLQEAAEEAASVDGLRKLFRMFAGYLADWNVTRDGEPVPASYEGLLSLDPGFVRAVTDGFIGAVTGIPGPLRLASSGGGSTPSSPDSLEASIPVTRVSPAS
jgi:hypothetical protein